MKVASTIGPPGLLVLKELPYYGYGMPVSQILVQEEDRGVTSVLWRYFRESVQTQDVGILDPRHQGGISATIHSE
jgi:hypothetical protein